MERWEKDTTQVGGVGGRKTCWQSLLEKLNLRGFVRIMLWGQKTGRFFSRGKDV